ncbi:MAG: strawberry notch-like NTP hydrolase domain-containing protein [Janthinobacterium lividum]
MPIAYLAGRAAAVTATDIALEPSAGTGLLAVQAFRHTRRIILNELDPLRASLLARLFAGTAVTKVDGASIADQLTQRPTVVLMNPPYSKSAGIGDDAFAGARHLRSALLSLADGGRLVAIMPSWFAEDASGAAGYAAVAKLVPPTADVLCLGSVYAKHGTGIDVRVMVYDKGRTDVGTRITAETLDDALRAVSALPPRLSLSTPAPIAKVAIRTLPTPSGGLLSRLSPTRQLTPRAPQLDFAGADVRDVAYTARAVPLPAADPVGIYVPYRVARIAFTYATPHPTPLVESLAMASIVPPPPSYAPRLPQMAATALSEAQLETVCYAGQSFERDLPGTYRVEKEGLTLVEDAAGVAYRAGYFLGDGTGAGKGRQVAAAIMDQWVRGSRRHVWVSKTSSLLEDARRDWSALGGIGIDIQPLTDWVLGTWVSMSDGILFTTYATLRSARPGKGSRLDQIIAWVTANGDATFEGLIVFDEAHAMANAAGSTTTRGVMKGSEQGICGVRLQQLLPRARVLYVSATGATDISNLAYATRLGLWGTGTAFETREIFMQQMLDGGMAAIELVARDLKALGLYTARALSFDGVEYDILEHRLTPAQVDIYDTYCDAWEVIHQNLDAVLAATNIVDAITGDTLNGQAKGAALSRFESTKQRFFAQTLTAMKLPTLLTAIEHDLATGHAVVIQLVSTAEAMLGRRLADLTPDERAELEIELSPREYVIDYLTTAFPTRAMETFCDDEGFLRSRPAIDADGNPVISAEAVALRDAMIEQLCALPAVSTALDEIVAQFGSDEVAEVTGRTKRLIRTANGEQKLESRSARTNLAETSAFMDGNKRIIVFSDAGGTGRSYHADNAAKNQRRRVHYLLEPGWRADAAIQGLGRSHRTNQASSPLFRPVTTDVKGEKRFISTIARRLDSLGALTRGQRQTGGQNLFNPADNLESDHAKEALTSWYHLLFNGKLTSIGFDAFCRRSGLVLTDKDSGGLKDDLPPIQRWLNRLLAFPIALQNAVFDEYLGLVEARIDALRAAGRLDVGVETIAAERIVEIERHLLRTDAYSGAETHLLRLELHRKPSVLGYDDLATRIVAGLPVAWLRNDRSGMVAAQIPSYSVMADDGDVITVVQLIRPTKRERMRQSLLDESSWGQIDAATFEILWRAEAEKAASRVDVEQVNLATGLLLPIWNKLPGDFVSVSRVTDNQGQSYLGRHVAEADLGKLAATLGIAIEIDVNVPALVAALDRRGTTIQLPGTPLTLKSVLVNGSMRVEVRDYEATRLDWYKSLGCFTEIVSYKTRLFLAVDRAEAIIGELMA